MMPMCADYLFVVLTEWGKRLEIRLGLAARGSAKICRTVVRFGNTRDQGIGDMYIWI